MMARTERIDVTQKNEYKIYELERQLAEAKKFSRVDENRKKLFKQLFETKAGLKAMQEEKSWALLRVVVRTINWIGLVCTLTFVTVSSFFGK